MSFESAEDLANKKKAARIFTNMFGGSFSALSVLDTDFKILDKERNLISYAEVVVMKGNYSQSMSLHISVSRLSKLCNKRLNPVIIWSFDDGIVYTKVVNISGKLSWGSLPWKASNPSTNELVAEFKQDKNFRYERS